MDYLTLLKTVVNETIVNANYGSKKLKQHIIRVVDYLKKRIHHLFSGPTNLEF